MGPRANLNAVARRKSPSPYRKSNPGRPARSVTAVLFVNMIINDLESIQSPIQ